MTLASGRVAFVWHCEHWKTSLETCEPCGRFVVSVLVVVGDRAS